MLLILNTIQKKHQKSHSHTKNKEKNIYKTPTSFSVSHLV